MRYLTGQPIITNTGRERMLTGAFAVKRIALGDRAWSPTADSDALQHPVSVIEASARVEPMPDGNYRLHITGVDDSDTAYELREFALLDSTGAVLAIHSQGTPIDLKEVDSDLTISAAIIIEDHD